MTRAFTQPAQEENHFEVVKLATELQTVEELEATATFEGLEKERF